MFGKGIPMVTTALALSSVKSSPSLTFPLQTAISRAPSGSKSHMTYRVENSLHALISWHIMVSVPTEPHLSLRCVWLRRSRSEAARRSHLFHRREAPWSQFSAAPAAPTDPCCSSDLAVCPTSNQTTAERLSMCSNHKDKSERTKYSSHKKHNTNLMVHSNCLQ